jgi:hypothetical protein
MRRRPRRRRQPVKKYSLSYLLSRQPKSLQKNEYYPIMMNYFYNSERLQRLRVSRRCYSLLQHAKIRPENLHHFYRTYRLPRDPFFPLFFKIKREYLQEQQRRKEERVQYIAARMRSLPEPILEFIKYLARFEQRCNRSGRYPVWSTHMFPSTKKRVREYAGYTYPEWLSFFRSYLELLTERYRSLTPETAEKLLACFVLQCLPREPGDGGSPDWPDHEQVVRQYRRLSLQHHPDRGGDGQVFVELQRAREVLGEGR